MRLKFLLCLLVAVLLALPQFAYSQEENEAEEEFADPNQTTIDSLLNLIKPESPDNVKAKNYCEIALIAGSVDTTLKYAFLALDFCHETDIELMARCNYYIAWGYFLNDQSKIALPYAIKSIRLVQNDNKLISKYYTLIARIYEDLNNLDSTKYYINLALEDNIRNNDTSNITECYRTLGGIFYNKTYLKEAEQYFRKAIILDSLIGDTLEYAGDYYRVAECLIAVSEGIDDLYIAKRYLTKAARLQDIINSNVEYYITTKHLTYGSLADVYIQIAKLTNNDTYADSCFYYIKKALDYFIKQGLTDNAITKGYTYLEYLKYYKKYNEALAFLKRQKKYFNENTTPLTFRDYYEDLKEIYLYLGDYKNAYECCEKCNEYRNESINDSSMTALADMKTEQAMMLEKIDRENAEKLHAAERQKMRIIIFSLIGGLALISLLVFYIFRVLKIKKKANADLLEKNAILIEQKEEIQAQRDEIEDQKEEIESQRDEIMAQRDHIEAQSKEIQASINYAQRIQRAMLTPDETIDSVFPDHFLLYKPRDIVSGDYYWVGQFGDNKVCIVADCTGHGVPGGFLSVLGMSNLNHIVGQDISPDAILNHLRETIISNLRQQNDDTFPQNSYDVDAILDSLNRSRDGMDVAAYVVNERQMKLSFAGANNPLVLIRNGEVQVLKADRMPVGIHNRLAPFSCTTIDIKKGDCLYTFSDGFQDQFGYKSDKKFMNRRLRDLLLEIHQRPMAEQKEILNMVYEEWRGPAENQTDDVVVMGVRI